MHNELRFTVKNTVNTGLHTRWWYHFFPFNKSDKASVLLGSFSCPDQTMSYLLSQKEFHVHADKRCKVHRKYFATKIHMFFSKCNINVPESASSTCFWLQFTPHRLPLKLPWDFLTSQVICASVLVREILVFYTNNIVLHS